MIHHGLLEQIFWWTPNGVLTMAVGVVTEAFSTPVQYIYM